MEVPMIVNTRGVYRNGKVEIVEPAEAPPDGTSVIVQYEARRRKSFREHSGTISDDEAQRMIAAIDNGCERVDRGEW
jgi:hypothetical protein